MKAYEYKIVLLGEKGVGKHSLISQLLYNELNESIYTLGSNIVQVNLGIINLNLWIPNGQNKYRAMTRKLIKDSQCAILIYDIANKETFNEIKNYYYDMAKSTLGDEALIYLVANKMDLFLEKEVSEEEARDYAKQKYIKFFEVSFKQGAGIDKLYEDIVNSLIKKFKRVLKNNNKKFINDNRRGKNN